MSVPATHAMCGDEVRQEMTAIEKGFHLLSPFDTAARFRILEWLQSWARKEAPQDERGMF